jgi:hypothetical protein
MLPIMLPTVTADDDARLEFCQSQNSVLLAEAIKKGSDLVESAVIRSNDASKRIVASAEYVEHESSQLRDERGYWACEPTVHHIRAGFLRNAAPVLLFQWGSGSRIRCPWAFGSLRT